MGPRPLRYAELYMQLAVAMRLLEASNSTLPEEGDAMR